MCPTGYFLLRIVAKFGVLIPLCALLGCKSYSPSQTISPKVVGRVVDAQTGQPVKDVKVLRNPGSREKAAPEPRNGAQVLSQPPVVRTGADGIFVLESVKQLAVFRTVGWYGLTLSFEHPAYHRFTTNYTQASVSTNASEAVVHTGDIKLIPN